MTNPLSQEEARRALADQIEASVFAFRLQGDNDMRITMSFDRWKQVIAALRAPSQDRDAEEMRERAAQVCEAVAESNLGKTHPMGAGAAHCCAQSIRALPLPQDSKGGEG